MKPYIVAKVVDMGISSNDGMNGAYLHFSIDGNSTFFPVDRVPEFTEAITKASVGSRLREQEG